MRIVRVAGDDAGPVTGHVVDGVVVTDDGTELGAVRDQQLLAPCTPSKIVGVGRNYRSNLEERGWPLPKEPFAFLKTPNAVAASGSDVQRPDSGGRMDFEAELALVISRPATRIPRSRWRDHVLGVTNANDLTVRAWQADGAQWWRAKSSDGLCPLGPWIDTDIDLDAPQTVRAWVDGELRQDGTTDDLVFGFDELLSFITRTMTLQPGDVVLTGSPAGAGPVEDGATVEVEVAGIGRLSNRIVRTQ